MANKFIILPGLIFRDIKTDAFLWYVLFFVMDIFFIWLFLKYKRKNQNTKFENLVIKKLGNIFGWFFELVLVIYFMVMALLITNEVFVFVRNYAYEDIGMYVFIICLLPVGMYGVSTGLRGIARTAEFYFKFIVIGVFICLAIGTAKINELPVFFTSSFGKFSFAGLSYIFWFTDFILMFIILDNVEYTKELPKKLYTYVLSTMALVLIVTFAFYSVYPHTAFFHGNAILDISKIGSVHSGLGRVDIIAMLVIVFLLFLQFSIILRGFSYYAGKVFKVEQSHTLWMFGIAFFILQYLVIKNLQDITFFASNVMGYFSISILVIFIVVLIIGLFSNKKKVKYGKGF